MREAVPLTIDDGLQVVHNKRKRRDRQCDNHEIAKQAKAASDIERHNDSAYYECSERNTL